MTAVPLVAEDNEMPSLWDSAWVAAALLSVWPRGTERGGGEGEGGAFEGSGTRREGSETLLALL